MCAKQGRKEGSDKQTVRLRVRQVTNWLIKMYSTPDIVMQIEQKWGLSQTQAYTYIDKAWELIEASQIDEKNTRRKLARHLEMRADLYRNLQGKELSKGARAALAILDSTARLEGILKTENGITPPEDNPIDNTKPLTPEEIKQMNEQLNKAYL